jgi:hypothetical protein
MNYNEFKKDSGFVENENFNPIIVKDIFSADQIKRIYDAVNNTKIENTHLQKWAGHRAWDTKFDKDIEDSITEKAKEHFGDNISLCGDYSFARYSPSYGYVCKLFPHYDTRDYQRITFDIQLNASEEWAIVVEGNRYVLENNQALMFAGTQQIHWRENKQINQEASIDMIFCHLQYVPNKEIENGQNEILTKRANFLIEETGISNEEIEIGYNILGGKL